MVEESKQRLVDHAALKTNQAFIIIFLLLAFMLDSALLAALVAAVMLVGTAVPQLALFKWIYRRVLRPAGLVNADLVPDNVAPHRFAQGFGGTVVTLAFVLLGSGMAILGWALVWLVIVLAALNLFLGFCAGCFLYYQMNRLGVPGFDEQPLAGR